MLNKRQLYYKYYLLTKCWVAKWRSGFSLPLLAWNLTSSCPRRSSHLFSTGQVWVRWHCLAVAPAQASNVWAHSVSESGRVGGPFAIWKVKSFKSLTLWLRCFLFSAIVRWNSGGWGDYHFFSLPFCTNCSEFPELAWCQLHLPLFNHSIDSSAKNGVIRPKIYHPEAYFNYPK